MSGDNSTILFNYTAPSSAAVVQVVATFMGSAIVASPGTLDVIGVEPTPSDPTPLPWAIILPAAGASLGAVVFLGVGVGGWVLVRLRRARLHNYTAINYGNQQPHHSHHDPQQNYGGKEWQP